MKTPSPKVLLMIPRFDEPPQAGRTYTPRPGVYVILPMGDEVLMTFQGGIHQEFQLPGGGIDPGESPLQALHREVREELGWSIARPRRLGAHRRFTYMPEYDKWAEKICHIYMAHPVRQICPPLEVNHEAVWLPIDQAQALVAAEGDAAFLARL